MSTGNCFEDRSRVLNSEAFRMVLESEIRRALRSQTFLSLVVVETKREWDGLSVSADDGTVHELAQLVGRDVRETDPIALTELGTLSLVLIDADFERAREVVHRLMLRIDSYEFTQPLSIAVGTACFPTHAVDMDTLRREAMARPLASRRQSAGPDRALSSME
jgi:hypothetical protein